MTYKITSLGRLPYNESDGNKYKFWEYLNAAFPVPLQLKEYLVKSESETIFEVWRDEVVAVYDTDNIEMNSWVNSVIGTIEQLGTWKEYDRFIEKNNKYIAINKELQLLENCNIDKIYIQDGILVIQYDNSNIDSYASCQTIKFNCHTLNNGIPYYE